jgi:hypothetical protein
MRGHKTNRWKGFVLGTLGGVVGIIAMQWYWQIVTAAEGEDPRKKQKDSPTPEELQSLDSISLVGKHHRAGESSTAAMGRIIYEAVTGKPPRYQETKTVLSYLVHWVISMGMSGLYGAIRGKNSVPDKTGGIVLGTALWALGDETAMPLLGLTEGPTAYPTELHIHGLGAHLAYGAGCALGTQFLYWIF